MLKYFYDFFKIFIINDIPRSAIRKALSTQEIKCDIEQTLGQMLSQRAHQTFSRCHNTIDVNDVILSACITTSLSEPMCLGIESWAD